MNVVYVDSVAIWLLAFTSPARETVSKLPSLIFGQLIDLATYACEQDVVSAQAQYILLAMGIYIRGNLATSCEEQSIIPIIAMATTQLKKVCSLTHSVLFLKCDLIQNKLKVEQIVWNYIQFTTFQCVYMQVVLYTVSIPKVLTVNNIWPFSY